MREKLIELLETVPPLDAAIIGLRGGKQLISTSRIADHLIANGVTVQGWIPVSERLPEDRGDVLVTRALLGERMRPQIGWYNEVASIWYIIAEDGYFTSNEVTHWMPLPTPPKEE